MSFTSLLKDTCTIQQKTNTQGDTGAKISAWTTKASGVLTRKRRNNQPKIYDALNKTYVDNYIFYFLPTVSITIDDRILADGINYEVLSVATDSEGHHLEVVAKLTQK